MGIPENIDALLVKLDLKPESLATARWRRSPSTARTT